MAKGQKRDPEGSYTFGGKIYGKDQPAGQSAADLDKLSPLAGGSDDEEEGTGARQAKGTPGEPSVEMHETGSVTARGTVVPAGMEEPDEEPLASGGSRSRSRKRAASAESNEGSDNAGGESQAE